MMKYIPAAIAIVIFCALLVGAQSIPPRKFKHFGAIVTDYDKEADLTTVLLGIYILNNPSVDPSNHVSRIQLIAGFTYTGMEPLGNPKEIEFAFKITRVNYGRENDSDVPELIAEIEGEQISLGKPVVLKSTKKHSIFTEKIGVLIPKDVFLKLINAKKVKLKSGNIKVTLRDNPLEALRDLASRMK